MTGNFFSGVVTTFEIHTSYKYLSIYTILLVMYFYEVAVESTQLKGHDSLTYSSIVALPLGSIVRVELRSKKVNGVVLEEVNKPGYKTKEILSLLQPAVISKPHLKLIAWISEYYATPLSSVVNLLLPRGAHKKRRSPSDKKPAVSRTTSDQTLSNQQSLALKNIKKASPSTVILHGVTGSGKTRIYLELALAARKKGQGSLILVPEIGLTSQIRADFESAAESVFVMHSQQTESTRHHEWQAISEATAPIVIGPRSALFSPIQKLGLIVLDEAHEPSYKQDQSPKYHATRVASQLAKFTGAQLVLGSATPRVEDYFLATSLKAPIIRLDKTVSKQHNLEAVIVDLKDRDKFTSGSRVFSDHLIESIKRSLATKKQVLLFHNRRGSSTSVICGHCGLVSQCPNCSLPLTHHADWQQLVCHICNHREPIKTACSECKKPELEYKGIGTKQIVSEVKKLFPNSTVARFDSDNIKDERLHERYAELHDGKIDIIVGTQGIAKGLDLPKLETVGVVMADVALHIPDYSASERTFQLLYQVIGRVGRHQNGRVIIQSYTPDHPALISAVERDYKSFYEYEIAERQLTNYPPFSYLLQLHCVRKTAAGAASAAETLAARLKTKGLKVFGPAPAFHERTADGGYRWQIVIKSRQRPRLVEIVDNLPANWQFELDPINLL